MQRTGELVTSKTGEPRQDVEETVPGSRVRPHTVLALPQGPRKYGANQSGTAKRARTKAREAETASATRSQSSGATRQATNDSGSHRVPSASSGSHDVWVSQGDVGWLETRSDTKGKGKGKGKSKVSRQSRDDDTNESSQTWQDQRWANWQDNKSDWRSSNSEQSWTGWNESGSSSSRR